MDPVLLSLTAVSASAVLLQHYQTGTETEMTPFSPRTTFPALGLNNKKGLQSAGALLMLLSLSLRLVFVSFLLRRSDYKQNTATGKTTGVFLLAEDGERGGCQLEETLCVGVGGGVEQVEKRGRGVLGLGGEGYGGVRIAGCGWVCQCHVSSLAPLASRLEGCWT